MNSPTQTDELARGTEKRLELRQLIDAAVKNPSNGNRHEEAIVDFILSLVHEREEAAREEGKAYWEPSEIHKDVWRKEGFNAGRITSLEAVIAEARGRTKEVPKVDPFNIGGVYLAGQVDGNNSALKSLISWAEQELKKIKQ